jgi:acetyl esterase/lipase
MIDTSSSTCYEVTLNEAEPPLRVRVYPCPTPTLRPTPGLLWINGGGFVTGSLEMPEGDAVCRALANTGISCVGVDYRRAPGLALSRARRAAAVRFPLPLDDCERGWRYLERELDHLNINRDALYIGGASAGGALATTLVLRLLRDGPRAPSGVVLAYPLLHSELPPLSDELRYSVRGLRRMGTFPVRSVRWMARRYVGPRHLERVPQALPGGSDLTEFPPALIVNAERDTLRASGEKFTEELRSHGGTVDMRFEPGTRHMYLNKPEHPGFTATISAMASWITNSAAQHEDSEETR